MTKPAASVSTSVSVPVWGTAEPLKTITRSDINIQTVRDEEEECIWEFRQPLPVYHDWYMGFPGNFCKRCGCDDPMELCMGGCDLSPSDENGYPNPFECPVHGNRELFLCPAKEEVWSRILGR